MKVLSVTIPCYNSAEYMGHAIDTLLTGGEDIEIIVVDDGSTKDNTLEIAKDYEKKFPNIVRAVHQENGGHGAAVNTGLANANGVFFKVVDSDDWVSIEALAKVMDLLRSVIKRNKSLDMLVCNYVYEKVGEEPSTVRYTNCLPENRFFTWQDVGRFRNSQYILMHSVFYRTALLKEIGLKLPEHTFYVDNIFVYYPLPYVKTMYYMDIDFYRYFIGRDDQSVNEKVMMGRMDQQLKITKILIEAHDLSKIKESRLKKYMANYLAMMMTICTVFLIKSGKPENIEKKREIWRYLKKVNPKMNRMIKHTLLGAIMGLPGKGGRKIIIWGYEAARKIYKFN